MTDVLAHLISQLEAGSPPIAVQDWKLDLGPMYQTASNRKWLGPVQERSELPCLLCRQAGHASPVWFRHELKQYRAFCPERGTYCVPEDEVQARSFDQLSFLSEISRGFGMVADLSPVRRLDEHTFTLGVAAHGTTSVSIHVALRLGDGDVLTNFLRRNRQGFGSSPGMVLCSSLPKNISDFGHHPLIRMTDILNLDENGITVSDSVMRTILSGRRALPKRAQLTKLDVAVEAIIADYDETGELPTGQHSLEQVFRSRSPAQLALPKRSTLFKALAEAKRRLGR